MLLALDASKTSTGYAIFNANSVLIEAGTLKTSTSTGIPIERYRLIQKEVEELLTRFNIIDVAVEGVVFGTGEKYRQVPALYGLYIQIQIILAEHKCRVVYLAPEQWRKIFWQPYRWKNKKSFSLDDEVEIHEYKSKSKQSTIDRIKRLYNIKLKSDEADAFCIGQAGVRFFNHIDNKLKTLTEDEKQVFYKTKNIGGEGEQKQELEQGLVSARNRLWFDFKDDLWKKDSVKSLRKIGYRKKGL